MKQHRSWLILPYWWIAMLMIVCISGLYCFVSSIIATHYTATWNIAAVIRRHLVFKWWKLEPKGDVSNSWTGLLYHHIIINKLWLRMCEIVAIGKEPVAGNGPCVATFRALVAPRNTHSSDVTKQYGNNKTRDIPRQISSWHFEFWDDLSLEGKAKVAPKFP